MTTWEDALWAELDALPPAERFIVAGEWTSDITHSLLTDLADARRSAVLEAVDAGTDATAFAEQVGASHQAVRRFLADARRERRRLQGPPVQPEEDAA
jgi:DNA-directed RNA polymerase specialized sigma24 family protein